MGFLTGAGAWGLGKARDAAVTAAKSLWKKAAADRELKAIRTRACERAIAAAPAFAEDLRSKSFSDGVLGPIVKDMLQNPGRPWAARVLARAYLERFVGPDAEPNLQNDVLTRIYRTEPSAVTDAFEAFLDSLREELQRSKHWKEAARDAILTDLRGDVKAILTFAGLSGEVRPDIALARADAQLGSKALRSWKRDIEGEEIERPELDELLERIRAHPAGRTLLVGEAGAGKSALLAKLTTTLEGRGVPVFAVKADLLPPEITDAAGLTKALGLKAPIEAEVAVLAKAGPMVLLIDQLDAVSDVMDRTSERMQVLLALVQSVCGDAGSGTRNIHVVVSSRPFEAAHDARFKSLRAEEVLLSLPKPEDVQRLLAALAVDAKSLSPEMMRTLRRPFALRLFVELYRRGEVAPGLAASGLLDAWLSSARLGEGPARSAALAFLRRLAADMTETEALWRPADLYDLDDRGAVALCLAAGLLERRQGRLGFSHQAWLDDFQAKALATAPALLDYIWTRQEGLFSRATALRALQRLRAFDEDAYLLAVDGLLGEARTRRHIRHLVVDQIATQADPMDRETAWVLRLIDEDHALARRAIGHIFGTWSRWRAAIGPKVPWMMGQSAYRWSAGALLRAEAALNPREVERLVLQLWPAPSQDDEAFEVIYRAGLWSPEIEARLVPIFANTRDRSYALVEYAKRLVATDRAEAAVQLVHLFIRTAPAVDVADLDLKDLQDIIGNADEIVARGLMPWVLSLVPETLGAGSAYVEGYPTLPGLPITWSYSNEGATGAYQMLRTALAGLAKEWPDIALGLLTPAFDVELDEVQSLVADTLAAAAPALASDSLDFLLADRRRFRIGAAYREDAEGVGHHVHGSASQALIAAIGPHLSKAEVQRLRDAILDWDHYKSAAWEDAAGRLYRDRLRWAEEARMPLLASLPPDVLTARKRRQVAEWQSTQPIYTRERGPTLSAVGPPMSADQMRKASDADILGMLDAVDDEVDSITARRARGRRRWPNTGGVTQLAQAFSAFAVECPARALTLLGRLDPKRHTYVAGDALRALAGKDAADPLAVRAAIHALIAKGFSGKGWRTDISWALEELASRLGGLSDAEVAMLEGWMTPYEPPEQAAGRPRAAKAEREKGQPTRSVVFGRSGGLSVVPQGNNNMLRAVHAGLIARSEPDYCAWLGVMERHVDMPENPEVWTSILVSRGASLFQVDRGRAHAFVEALWGRHPQAFEPLGAARFTWTCRPLMPAAVIEGLLVRWLGSADNAQRQAAGEFSTALKLLGEGSEVTAMLACALSEAKAGHGRVGVLFGAANAWRENDGALRANAHKILRDAAGAAAGDEATAIAAVIEGRGALRPDGLTKDLLGWLVANPILLGAFLKTRFVEALQSLLLTPGFEEIVLDLVEQSVELLVARQGGGGGFVSRELVSLAIALQRGGGARRSRAMDAYEALLDIDAYGADAAALASLRT